MYRFIISIFLLLFVFECKTAYSQTPIGDTLTIIQKPILNIPAIVKPGDTLSIYCKTDYINSKWTAELLLNKNEYSLKIIEYNQDANTGWWILKVKIPKNLLFELYDLKVNTHSNESDVSWDAVRVIPEERSSYYFIQITDTHLPTHKFYEDSTAKYDTSELLDFYKVIEDINLINPEFVLLTGDLVNEGELEELDNRRAYTTSQRMLTYLDVPVYLTAGNHDIGGWIPTPEPDGTARRYWWKFFGWDILDNPPNGYQEYTQNYSFDYGNVHFTALESYDNYDKWRSHIYGNESFTANQLLWLQNDLYRAGNNAKKVLFYHYDFKHEIDLNALNVDMALWGHTHREIGDVSVKPFDLCCDNVCDGTRAYRVIKVENGELKPYPVSYTGANDNNISVSYSPENNGSHSMVTATITNSQVFGFENGLIKFIMPKYEEKIFLINGKLIQVDTSSVFPIYYVEFSIDAKSELSVILSLDSIQIPADSNVILLDEGFDKCPPADFQTFSVLGSNDWICDTYINNSYMKANAYQADTASNDWLITPGINLDQTKDENLCFKSWTMYWDEDFPQLKLLYSTNYQGFGNPISAEWDTLTFIFPEINSQKWVNSGYVDISHINGANVFFAWQYTSTGIMANECAMWFVDDILIKGKKQFTEIEMPEQLDFQLYPNPAHDFCFIEFDNKMKGKSNLLEVFDVSGKTIIRESITDNYQFSTSGFHRGIYIVRISTQDEIICKKLIVQ